MTERYVVEVPTNPTPKLVSTAGRVEKLRSIPWCTTHRQVAGELVDGTPICIVGLWAPIVRRAGAQEGRYMVASPYTDELCDVEGRVWEVIDE